MRTVPPHSGKLTLVANVLLGIVPSSSATAATVIPRNFLTYFVCPDRDANCTEYITACIEVAQEFECSTGTHFRWAMQSVTANELNGELTRRWMRWAFQAAQVRVQPRWKAVVAISSLNDHTVSHYRNKTLSGVLLFIDVSPKTIINRANYWSQCVRKWFRRVSRTRRFHSAACCWVMDPNFLCCDHSFGCVSVRTQFNAINRW